MRTFIEPGTARYLWTTGSKYPLADYIEEQGTEWKAILATVSADWIRLLYKQYEDDLFSANYRDYLGYKKHKDNINYQITQTATLEPSEFWVYNNGITALTNEIDLGDPIRIRGISIINGAQTSGALGNTPELATEQAKVIIRIVECRSRELVNKIILYNNTQNEIKSADRRSNDTIQRRLRTEFQQYGVTYVHRRSAARAPRNAIVAAAIARSLCALHGDTQTAYRNANDIFNDDDTYRRVFPPNISIEHVFLVRQLSAAIDRVKTSLNEKVSDKTATKTEMSQSRFLQHSASKHFLFYLMGSLAEEIMGKRVSDLYEWKCIHEVISDNNVSLSAALETALRTLLPFMAMEVSDLGDDAFYDVPRSVDLSKQVARRLKALVAARDAVLGDQFDDVRRRTTV